MIQVSHIEKLIHSPIHNYIVPGLTSWLIGESSPHGKVRIFTCDRNHQESIVPHSHRYDFQCMVLKGKVINVLWSESTLGDEYCVSDMVYKDEVGKYERCNSTVKRFNATSKEYNAGDCYYMEHHQIHSIYFKRNTVVLFFEGPEVAKFSVMLEPYVNNQRIPTGDIQDWMFLKGT